MEKNKLREFYRSLRGALGQGPVVVNAASRLRAADLKIDSGGHVITETPNLHGADSTTSIHGADRLLAYDNTWIKKMEHHQKTHPKYNGQQKPQMLKDEHIFNLQPSALAQRLRTLYKDDYKGAMGSLTAYKNRAGKNLLSPDRDRLDKAKDELRKLYGKDDDQNPSSTTPSSLEPTVPGKPTNERVGKERPIGSRPTTRTV